MPRMAPDYVAELSPGQKLRILLPNQKLRSLIIFREGHFKIWTFLETLDSLGGIEHYASWNWIKNRALHQNVNSSLNEILLRWYNSLIPMFALMKLKQGNFFACLSSLQSVTWRRKLLSIPAVSSWTQWLFSPPSLSTARSQAAHRLLSPAFPGHTFLSYAFYPPSSTSPNQSFLHSATFLQ